MEPPKTGLSVPIGAVLAEPGVAPKPVEPPYFGSPDGALVAAPPKVEPDPKPPSPPPNRLFAGAVPEVEAGCMLGVGADAEEAAENRLPPVPPAPHAGFAGESLF